MKRPSSDAAVLCECFARDGLQHEPAFVPTDQKIALLNRFSALGFLRIEATSFTHPGNVPQFTDSDAVLRGIRRAPGARYKATCVNLRSVERALAAADAGYGPDEISVTFQDGDGHTHTLRCNGLLARCIQHEADHLNGILFIDRMEKDSLEEVAADIKALKKRTREAAKK